MPTWTGIALLGLLAVLAIAGMLVWAWQQSRRSVPPSLRHRQNGEAPYSAENASSAIQHRVPGPGGGG